MNIVLKYICALFLITTIAAQGQTSLKKTNIVYILADDMGVGDVMAYNKDSKIATPNIDKLAKEGMRFTDAHTNSSVCTPTRYGIMTGRYAWRTSLKKGVLHGHSPHLINTSRETVASLLKKQGYKTACVGKWHLGMDWAIKKDVKNKKSGFNTDFSTPIKNGPLDVGFDYFYGISGSLNMNPHLFIENRKAEGTLEFIKKKEDLVKRGIIEAKPGWISKEFVQEEVLSTFTKKTCDWIKKNAEDPFFVYMPLNSPHSPIVPSEKFKGKSGLNRHGDFCIETDWAVGQVIKTLEDLGLTDNTIVIFTADNGTSPKAGIAAMAKKGHHSSWIYRGLKGTSWEGGHRVPFIVRWPGKVKKASTSNELICTTDLIATCAEILDLNLKDNSGEDSVSFLPALQGKKIEQAKNRGVVHHSDKGIFSIRSGKWKLMFDNYGGSHRKDPRIDEPIKDNDPNLLLFDMENDSTEDNNLAYKYPKVVEQLKKKLAKIIKDGRSTSGKNQPTDLNNPTLKWEQLSVVKEYLNK